MLSLLHKSVAHPPPELHSPDSLISARRPRIPEDILQSFHANHPDNCCSIAFNGCAALACVTAARDISSRRRLFCSFDDIHCTFLGSLHNLSSLVKQYGLCSRSNEAMFVIEAYRTLRDRGPYPADQVVKDLDGSFAFVVYDGKAGAVFCAMSSDGGIQLYWGIAADGSVAISNELDTIKDGCGRSFAPFPAGCMFHSEGGLRSFEHPMNRMKVMPRVDSEGVMCGANFKVDCYSRISSMPRVGSAADWTSWDELPR